MDDDLTILTDAALARMLGCSRVKIWQERRAGRLPQPVKIGTRNGTTLGEARTYVRSLLAERDQRRIER